MGDSGEECGDGDLEGGMIPVAAAGATENTDEVGAADTAASRSDSGVYRRDADYCRGREIDSSNMNGRDRVASDNDSRRNNSKREEGWHEQMQQVEGM